MAGFKKKTLKDIQSDFICEYTTRLRKYKKEDSPLLPIAVVRSLAWAVAGIVVLMWNYLAWVYLQILPQYCGIIILKLWGALVGVDYKYGTKTTLKIELTNVTAGSIMAETLWKCLKNGVVYKSLSTIFYGQRKSPA